MKNKILLSSLLLIAVVLVAVVSYKITISTPVEDFTHKPVTSDKKAIKPEKNHTEKSSENDTAGKKKIVASKEVNSVNLQILSSADLEHIAKKSYSMNDFIAVLQNKEKLPVSLSLNLLLTAISNFENEMKLEILFYEKSPYNKLLKTLSDSPSTDLEVKKEVERILISKSEPDYKAVELFTQFVNRNSDHIEALLKDERFIPLKDSLELQNKFLHSSSSISNLKSFESIYTESVCNSEGDSFIEKIDSVKRISGSGLAEQQQKIYEYLLKTLPSRVPLSKKYERQIYASFNTMHIPFYSGNNLNTKDYYLTETTEPGYKDLELASDFYNLQSRYYSFMEKEGSDYFSAEFMFKVSSMSKLFSRLNDLQRKIPQGLEINLEFTKAEKELLNFQLPSTSIINTIDVDGKCLQLHATLKPSAGLKVQLFNKILPRVLLPFYKKTEFKELLSEK